MIDHGSHCDAQPCTCGAKARAATDPNVSPDGSMIWNATDARWERNLAEDINIRSIRALHERERDENGAVYCYCHGRNGCAEACVERPYVELGPETEAIVIRGQE